MELTMAMISMWENTSDIRGVLVKEEEKPVVTETVAVEQTQIEVEQPEVQQQQNQI